MAIYIKMRNLDSGFFPYKKSKKSAALRIRIAIPENYRLQICISLACQVQNISSFSFALGKKDECKCLTQTGTQILFFKGIMYLYKIYFKSQYF